MFMRTGSSDILSQRHRSRNRVGTRLTRARRPQLYKIDLEGLESRTLLATIPAATATGAPINLSNLPVGDTGFEYAGSPTVAVNPYNSKDVIASWVDDIPAFGVSFVDGAYSTDGGASWTSLPNGITVSLDAQANDPSVGFDSTGNVYVLDLQHATVTPTGNPIPATGTLVLNKFSFAGSGGGTTLKTDFINQVLYQWVSNTTGDAMLNPVLAVDPGTYPNSTPASIPPAGVTKDPQANNVYVAWASNDIPDSQVVYAGGFNPNRIELIVSSDGGQSFSGVTTVNNGDPSTATLGGGLVYTNPDDGNSIFVNNGASVQDNAHPQIVINSNNNGQVSVGWNNLFTGALQSNSVQTGISTAATQTLTTIGNFFGPLIPDPRGSWVQPTPATSIYNAGPNPAASEDPVALAIGDVNGDGNPDIVVADDNSSAGGIGVLLNQTTKGTFPPAGATVFPAGNNPVSVALAQLLPGEKATTLDAIVSNDTPSGGVSLDANGIVPADGTGVFQPPVSLATAAGTSAVAAGNFDGSGNQIVAVNKDANSVMILDPATGKILKTLTAGLNAPSSVVVADFNGDGTPDIGVLNSGNNTLQFFLDESTGQGNFNFRAVTPSFAGGTSFPANVVAMTGAVNGAGPNLVLVTNSPNKDSVWVLNDLSTAGTAAVQFTANPVAGSGFDGTPVAVATGVLSTGTSGADIAVAYAATGTNESMVAVFRNLGTNFIFKGRNFGFQRIANPASKTGGDYDAGQTNPTAIAVGNLTQGTNKWDDIVVANNDGRGTISVLQPAARPVPSSAPAPNDFPVTVNVPNPAAVTGLAVSVALTATALTDLKLTLIAPNGDTFLLLKNGAITGTSLGVVNEPGDVVFPMTFDDNATRDILDASGLKPIIGNWRPQSDYITTDTLDQFVKQVYAANPSKFNGTWTLRVTDSTAASTGFLDAFSLQFTTGMKVSKTEGTISSFSFNTTVGGSTLPTFVMPPNLGDNYVPVPIPNLGYSLASPLGVGPGLVLGQDNTLGPDSPYQGRIYAAFVGYFNVTEPGVFGVGNPTDNTDIFEVYSDDGGLTWSAPVLVNNDQSQLDGKTESNDAINSIDQVIGRVQFQPAIAVDQATGTLVVSWRDGRDDPSRARVATYLATSIDGGVTFGAQTSANPAVTAVDSITGKTESLGPALDNQSTGTPTTTPGSSSTPDTEFGYGTQMGLAVFNGQLYPVWAGNFNQGIYDPLTNTVLGLPLNIFYRPMVIAAGPRFISSRMGPISLAEAASGSVSIPVTFDRPIVAGSFTNGDVQVFYRDTTNGHAPIQLEVTGIIPAGDGTNFTVTFDPKTKADGTQSGITNFTGTYSYLIAPDDGVTAISAPVWSFQDGVLREGAPLDQNADGMPDQNAVTKLFNGLTPGDVYAVPNPMPVTPVPFLGALSILHFPFDQNTLPLIVPGPQILSTQVVSSTGQPGTGADNLLVNGTTSEYNVTFDRPIETSSFTPDQVLEIMGPAGSVSGPQFFPSSSFGQTIPGATASGPGMLDSTLSIPSFNGTFQVAKVTVELSATVPADSGLTAILIAPDGTSVTLFSGVGGTNTTFVNTVLDDSSGTSITSGTAPFTGTYRPAGQLSSLNGKTVDMQNPADPAQWIPGVWTLRLLNSKSGTGMLGNWSVNVTPVITVAPVNPMNGTASEFEIGFPVQQLSGTYTIQLGTGIQDAFKDAVDTNQNAGLDVLRGQGQNAPTTTVAYSANDLPKAIPAPSKGAVPGQVSSTITVPDDFLVQGDKTSANISGLRVQINIAYPTDPDLTATLYYDMGTTSQVEVPLFSGVGGGAKTANFTNTVFDDRAGTPIQNGSAPFFATFNPQEPLADFANLVAKGTWTLVIMNNSTTGGTGMFNGWTLSFQKPLPTSGLGELGSDNISTSFRIFTLGQTDAMSGDAWTPVGPAAISSGSGSGSDEESSAGGSGRVSGLAIDPSDPSGNTVYAAGASGGVWKTNDFLTTSPNGPTWVPLTDFGPTNAVNIGSITVFARNHDPNQTIVIAATGEGNTQTAGVGFLISTDGGATWNLDDSTVNVDASGNPLPIESTARDRAFVGTTAYKVVVDPKLTPNGQAIIYAALSGPNGGIWRTENSGQTWLNVLAGQATDVVLDADSGTVIIPDSDTAVQGNLQIVYAGMSGQGVFMSPNQGQVWSLMTGGVGNPLIVNNYLSPAPNVNPIAGPTPNGAFGRIVLAVPAPTGNAAQDPIYNGWLYAGVVNTDGTFNGLFETKDFGQNWTQIRIPSLPPVSTSAQAIPTNDITQSDYAITGGAGQFTAQGNYDFTLAVDPADPSIVYLGGTRDGGQTGLIRIDSSTIWDAHALVATSDTGVDAGGVDPATTGPAGINQLLYTDGATGYFAPGWYPTGSGKLDFTQYVNFIRNPNAPFLANATLHVYNYSNFTNNGAGALWIPFDMGGTDYHSVATTIDPTTGLPRLIFGNDQGVWSVLDNNGTFETQIGSSDMLPDISRNGNLQITQFYYGAAQPSSAAAQIAGALFYGSAQDNGGPVSDPNIISNGNITWHGPGGDAAGVATDQQGVGTAYQFFWPCCGGADTNFFQYIPAGLSGAGLSPAGQSGGGYVGRTFGLLQASNGLPTPDPQWPFEAGANFAVDPVNSNDVVISSSVGRIFSTTNQGVSWFDIGDPGIFDSPNSFSAALAYGAPDPNAPSGIGNLGNFIYVGTQAGEIFVTQDGGGTGTTNDWINISAGLDGAAIKSIVADPTRGSHDAYAVTSTGVFVINNSIPSASNPTPTWVAITGNIHNLPYDIFGQKYDPTTDPNSTKLNQAQTLNTIVADWRYSIPDDPQNPGAGSHPALYVGGNSGVYQSLDNGKTWTLFPDAAYGAVSDGGNLPHVTVTDLSTSLGNIDPNTGFAKLSGPLDPSKPNAAPDPDVLLATTYGRGSFAINLAPLIVGNTVSLAPTAPGVGANSPPFVGGPITISGLSEISAYGNTTWVTVEDVTEPANPTVIAGYDPNGALPTPSASNSTDANGNFAFNFDPGSYYTSYGLKKIEVFATDATGSVGNHVFFTFNYDPATQLKFDPKAEPPATAQPGANFASPNPVLVDALDTNGNIATTYNGPVTITLTGGATGLVGSPVTVDAVAGIATFSSLAISMDGTYKLFAASPGLTSDTSTSIYIVGAATQLFIAQQPPNPVVAGTGFGFTVGGDDVFGNPTTIFPANATVSVALASNPGASNPLGVTMTVPVVGGIATFNGLTLNKVGQGYTLKVTSAGLASATTNGFNVVNAAADHLLIAPANEPPTTVTAGQTFGMSVTALDPFGNVDLGFSGQVTVSIAGGVLTGTTTVGVTKGVAAFTSLAIDTTGTFQINASSSPALTTTNSTSILVTPAAPSQLVWDSEPPGQVIHNFPFGAALDLRDKYGNLETNVQGTVTIALDNNPGGANLGGDLTADLAGGVTSFTNLSISAVGNGYTLQATSSVGGFISPPSTPIDVLPTPAVSLAITAEPPSSVTVHQGFDIKVAALDQFGSLDPDFNGSITVALASGPAAQLGGTLTATASNGVAMFSGLSVDLVGTGYTLAASSAGLAGATSTSFTANPAAASQLLITTEPKSSVAAGAQFGFVVTAEDQYNNIATGFNGNVTIAVASGPGGTLTGTTNATATNGVATLSGLILTQAGSGYTLQVSSPNLTSATTTAITVTPLDASRFVITTQPPSSITAGSAFGFTVTAEDTFGNVATTFNTLVSIGLARNPGTGTLGGSLSQRASGGVAQFSGLTLKTVGTGYTIDATNGTLTSLPSNPITVTPAAAATLVVTIPPPTTMTSGSQFGLAIGALDAYGNLATGYTGVVTIALENNPGNATLGGPLTATAVGGIANFHAFITTETAASGYTLQGTAAGLTSVTTGPIAVIPAPATHLVVITQPPSLVTPGGTFGFVVAAEDDFGNIAAGYIGTVSVATPSGSGAVLGGTTTVTPIDGKATFSGLKLTETNGGVALSVTSTGLTGATTNVVSVTTPASLAFATSTVTVNSGVAQETIEVARTGGYQGAITVNVATANGSAVAGVNYTAVNQVLNFDAGQHSQTVIIPLSSNASLTSDVSFSISLSSPGQNATLGAQSTATLVIHAVNQVPPPPALVAMQSVQLVTNKKHLITQILVGFSGGVNASQANSTTTYQLIAANKAGLFKPTKKSLIKIKSATLSGDTVALKLKSPLKVKKAAELVVNGVAPNGLRDSIGRLIDGNHDGTAGGNAVAVINRPGVVTINAVPRGPLAIKLRSRGK
jgi:subtilisin-like proprotein convertase family protein